MLCDLLPLVANDVKNGENRDLGLSTAHRGFPRDYRAGETFNISISET
jgi:hypothetical protein